MASALRVRVRPATEKGRLKPFYDTEADILEVTSNIRREWPFGVDVLGKVVFDLDGQRVLANFDLLIPKHLWKVRETLEVLKRGKPADLEFSPDTVLTKSFVLPLEVHTNQSRSCALITFGEPGRDHEVVELSKDCYALLSVDVLTGLFVNLRHAQTNRREVP